MFLHQEVAVEATSLRTVLILHNVRTIDAGPVEEAMPKTKKNKYTVRPPKARAQLIPERLTTSCDHCYTMLPDKHNDDFDTNTSTV